MAKEVWDTGSLGTISRFVARLQDDIQENAAEEGLRVKDVLIVVEDEEKPRGKERETWGLISLQDRDDTILQFEPIDAEIGLV